MNYDELKNMIDDYYDSMLTPIEKERFEADVEEHPEIVEELEKLKKLSRKLRNLPLSFEPSDEIIFQVINGMLKVEKSEEEIEVDAEKDIKEKEGPEKKKEEKSTKSKKKKKPKGIYKQNSIVKYIFYTIFIAIIGAGAYYYFIFKETTTPWTLKLESGHYLIDNSLSNAILFDMGQRLVTLDDTKLQIIIRDQGVLTLFDNTDLSIVTANTEENRILLKYGKAEFIPLFYQSNFFINFNGSEINAYNSKFTAAIDSLNSTEIFVETGKILITTRNESLWLSHNYFSKIEDGQIIRLPYHKDASRKLKRELVQFDYSGDYAAMTKILRDSKPKDALTLHYLLYKVEPAHREMVYNKLKNFVPLPSGVNKDGIIRLDKKMMTKWWNAIHITI